MIMMSCDFLVIRTIGEPGLMPASSYRTMSCVIFFLFVFSSLSLVRSRQKTGKGMTTEEGKQEDRKGEKGKEERSLSLLKLPSSPPPSHSFPLDIREGIEFSSTLVHHLPPGTSAAKLRWSLRFLKTTNRAQREKEKDKNKAICREQ